MNKETRGLKKSEIIFEMLCMNEGCFSSIISLKSKYKTKLKKQLVMYTIKQSFFYNFAQLFHHK